MKRTTVTLPADLKDRAERRAYERGISVGELLRESLENALEVGEERRVDDPLFKDVAVYEGSTPKNLSARHDQYLCGGQDD